MRARATRVASSSTSRDQVTPAKGLRRLDFHTQPVAGSFLELLRPYRGVRDEVLDDVMGALRAAAPLIGRPTLPRQLVSALWAISRLGHSWALEPGGMLRRNHLIGETDQQRLSALLERFDFAVVGLLQGVSVEATFGSHGES